jgi:hypothetical protein
MLEWDKKEVAKSLDGCWRSGFPYVVCGRPKPGEEPVRKEPAREHM